MEPRRAHRQHRSCDPCRKGKRACDGEAFDNPQGSPCSNCKRWRKDCTYNWLHATRSMPREKRRKEKSKQTATATDTEATRADAASMAGFGLSPFDFLPQLPADSSTLSSHASDWRSTLPSGQTGFTLDSADPSSPGLNMPGSSLWDTMSAFNDPFGDGGKWCDGPLDTTDAAPAYLQSDACPLQPYQSISGESDTRQEDPLVLGFTDSDDSLFEHLLESGCTPPAPSSSPRKENASRLSFISDDLTTDFERLALTRNMFHIYHDSLENALSCWLTEKTCPYSGIATTRSAVGNGSNSPAAEWGPNWSNRICSRVHRLDRGFATVRGRHLTAVEDKMASRALFAAIMAFSSQWATGRQQRSENLSGSGLPPTEHFCRENLWNQARHALDASAGLPSFKVVFGNIIFSLTQRPLRIEEQISLLDSWSARSNNGRINPLPTDDAGPLNADELHGLFDNDCAPLFLDTAMRQLFSFRHKMTSIQRARRLCLKMDSLGRSTSQRPNLQPRAESAQTASGVGSRNLLSAEDNDTFNLLFWLGIMFDTLTAAIHQRPPVVSDEDSDISCAVPLSEPQVPWNETSTFTPELAPGKTPVIWGDLFLRKSATSHGSDAIRWPCTYNEAAEVLSEAAPVKVLLFRRISHIQTLIYRGLEGERLEQAVQDAFRAYHHWNDTYGRFMLDCVANHDNLPPRIQSWYVILDGHWHLGAMLLADTLDSIDQAGIGMDLQRESRRAMDITHTLRRDNAVAVSKLAHCSLQGQDPSFAKARMFHDSVNERAFVTEPWTALLTRSFTKAGYNLLNEVDESPHAVAGLAYDSPSEQAQRQCGYCLEALWCLGRKSDMALLAARVLYTCAEGRLRRRYSEVFPAMDNDLSSIPRGYDHGIPPSSLGSVF